MKNQKDRRKLPPADPLPDSKPVLNPVVYSKKSIKINDSKSVSIVYDEGKSKTK